MLIVLKTILISVQVLALLVASKYYYALKPTTERFYLIYLVLVVIVEFLGLVSSTQIVYINNPLIYNTYMLVSFVFYYDWFYRILKTKKAVIYCAISFFLSYTYSIIYEEMFNNLFKYTLGVGAISILILVFAYYLEILKSNSSLNLMSSTKFWLATSIMLFHIGFFPLCFFQGTINTYGLGYSLMLTVLNIIVYGSFIFAFLCIKKN